MFSVQTLLVLSLGPGLLMTLFYLLVMPELLHHHLPPVWGQMMAALVVIIPLELGILLITGKRIHGCYTLRGAVLYNEPLPLRQYLWLVPGAVLSALLLPGLVVWLEPWLQKSLFSWLPAWFSTGISAINSYPPTIRWITFGLWIASLLLAGPIVEELYFRGFLLPRTPGGRLAPLINAWLFAIYHFWQPYTVLTVTLFALPLAYLVWWRRNVYLSIIAHCTVNAFMFLSLVAGVIER